RHDLRRVGSDNAVAPRLGEPQRMDGVVERVTPIWRRVLAAVVQICLVAAVIFGGVKAYTYITDTAPRADRASRERAARLVEVLPVVALTQGPEIVVWGEVRAAQTLVVRPELSGTVVWVHPEVTPGGRLRAGEIVARLDDRDFRLALGRAEADIAGVEARILIEQGQADLGRLELRRLSRNLTDAQRNLILRKPQMAQLEAELTSAINNRTQAEIALARTEVMAPFDAVVLSESVAPGALLPQGTEVARLVAADRFEISLAVPANALDWIEISPKTPVIVSQPGAWPAGTARTVEIVRVGSSLTETGRMAELIVQIDDPLSLQPENGSEPAMLLGSFVQATIAGTAIDNAVMLDRALLRDDDTTWIMTADETLEVRKLDIAWRGAGTVLVRGGLDGGDRVIVTPLATVAPGMALRTRDEVSG
ncbi:MAG: efflux RND transporter periplasmic adaptor subunit, partial [Pseudomonadota bacterium]